MDLTVIATTIATLIFTEASKEGGKFLGKAVPGKISELINSIREKFKQSQIEVKLENAEKEPTEKNIDRFKKELEQQMEDDENFYHALKNIVEQLQSEDVVPSNSRNSTGNQNVNNYGSGNITGFTQNGDVNL